LRRTLAVLVLGLMSCSTDYTDVTLSAGQWGGLNADLQVTEAGATALFKCGARGVLGEPLVLDSSAHFQVTGTYEPLLVQSGPQPATYLGVLAGDRLALTVRLQGQSLGPFDLEEGRAGTFDPCNY
jgi:hypothetical protein